MRYLLLLVMLLSSCTYVTSRGLVRPNVNDSEYERKMRAYLMEVEYDRITCRFGSYKLEKNITN
ncbi:MAG: hypothetical protein ACRCVW_02615 [Brevinema sp.]